MIFAIMLDATEEEIKLCIVAGMIKEGYDEGSIATSQIHVFKDDEVIQDTDLLNMLKGSCLSELCKNGNMTMKRVL